MGYIRHGKYPGQSGINTSNLSEFDRNFMFILRYFLLEANWNSGIVYSPYVGGIITSTGT